MVIVRELTGGIYYGERGRKQDPDGNTVAFDTETYNQTEIDRIAKVAFELAGKRHRKVCSIDKANVLESSRLWRERVHVVAKDYPDIELIDMLVDNAAMQLVKNPAQFDVIVTSNMFGDILSDEASQLTGSIGLLPSASLSSGRCGMYEPIHGSAPDIAGKGIANPIATIVSVAMMLRYAFDMNDEADRIEQAIEKTLQKGCRTIDILDNGTQPLGTNAITDAIIAELA
jgi:3-isopropylmalate dehydrogenase